MNWALGRGAESGSVVAFVVEGREVGEFGRVGKVVGPNCRLVSFTE